jgi:hypothetical protein
MWRASAIVTSRLRGLRSPCTSTTSASCSVSVLPPLHDPACPEVCEGRAAQRDDVDSWVVIERIVLRRDDSLLEGPGNAGERDVAAAVRGDSGPNARGERADLGAGPRHDPRAAEGNDQQADGPGPVPHPRVRPPARVSRPAPIRGRGLLRAGAPASRGFREGQPHGHRRPASEPAVHLAPAAMGPGDPLDKRSKRCGSSGPRVKHSLILRASSTTRIASSQPRAPPRLSQS